MTCAPLLDRRAQRQGQAEAGARGVARRQLAAGAQRQHPRAGRDAGDADPVVGPRRDDAGHRGAVVLADVRPVAGDRLTLGATCPARSG